MTTAPTETSDAQPRRSPVPVARVAVGAVLAAGIAIGFVVARDGTPGWQLARLAAVALVTAGLRWVLVHGPPAARVAAPLVAGCIALAVGVGIGLPHLAKTGAAAPTIAGLVALTGGLVLIGWSVWTTMRITHGWGRVASVLGVLAVTAMTLWTFGQAVAATNVPRTAVASTTPGDRGLDHRDVEFETRDGVTLSGWYIPSRNGAAVVLFHGAGSTRSGVLDHAEVLATHGYGVLLFDARGHGRSDGRAMDFGWCGDEDGAAAVSFLQAQPDVDASRIAAVGMSMGGEEAIGAAAADPRIAAVVAEGATTRVTGDKAWLSDTYGWQGSLQEALDWLTYTTADLLSAADPPMTLRAAVAATAPRPVLLIAGGDTPDEDEAGRFIQAGSPGTVELWVVPATGHTDAVHTQPREWEERVTTFLADALDV